MKHMEKKLRKQIDNHIKDIVKANGRIWKQYSAIANLLHTLDSLSKKDRKKLLKDKKAKCTVRDFVVNNPNIEVEMGSGKTIDPEKSISLIETLNKAHDSISKSLNPYEKE